MKVIADLSTGKLIFGVSTYSVSCNVRSLKNRTRRKDEVVLSIPGRLPYDPCRFPEGIWRITGVEWQKERGFDYNTYGPVKIRTDAERKVNVWSLDSDCDYFKETNRQVMDSGYLLHYSSSKTTLGCIRIGSVYEAETLGKLIEKVLKEDIIELEVI